MSNIIKLKEDGRPVAVNINFIVYLRGNKKGPEHPKTQVSLGHGSYISCVDIDESIEEVLALIADADAGYQT